MTTHEVLVEARNAIDRGWCQTYGFDPEGPHCPASAVEHVTSRESPDVRAILARTIGCTESWVTIGYWNDAPGRTKAEVLAAFDAAIAATAPAPADPFPSELPDLTPVS